MNDFLKEQLELMLNRGFSSDNPYVKGLATVSLDNGYYTAKIDDETRETERLNGVFSNNRKRNKNRFK